MSGPRIDGNLFSMVLCGRPSSEAATVPGADCHSAVAMPPPCKPFWPKNHAIRPYFDTFQGNSYSGDLPTSGKLRTNRQLVGIQEPYSLHIVEGNGPGSSGAGWNRGGRVQNKPRMVGGFHQTRLGQLVAKKYGTVSADLMRQYDTHWKRHANPSPQLPAFRWAAALGSAFRPTRKRRVASPPYVNASAATT